MEKGPNAAEEPPTAPGGEGEEEVVKKKKKKKVKDTPEEQAAAADDGEVLQVGYEVGVLWIAGKLQGGVSRISENRAQTVREVGHCVPWL